MTLYPEVQKKAQEEIDRVVGNDRLPSFADYDNLPYIRAMGQHGQRSGINPDALVRLSG